MFIPSWCLYTFLYAPVACIVPVFPSFQSHVWNHLTNFISWVTRPSQCNNRLLQLIVVLIITSCKLRGQKISIHFEGCGVSPLLLIWQESISFHSRWWRALQLFFVLLSYWNITPPTALQYTLFIQKLSMIHLRLLASLSVTSQLWFHSKFISENGNSFAFIQSEDLCKLHSSKAKSRLKSRIKLSDPFSGLKY